MNEKQKEIVWGVTLFASIFCLIFIVSFLTYNQNSLNQVYKDTNQLLQNDLTMANYIQANSQTMEYLNKNCKQTSDTNTTITLTCIKVNQQ